MPGSPGIPPVIGLGPSPLAVCTGVSLSLMTFLGFPLGVFLSELASVLSQLSSVLSQPAYVPSPLPFFSSALFLHSSFSSLPLKPYLFVPLPRTTWDSYVNKLKVSVR